MQEKRKKIIGDFVDLLTEEIEGAVKADISIYELAKYKNILIVRSTKNAVLHSLVKELVAVNPDINLNILGGALDREFFNDIVKNNEEFSYHHYVYDGRFDVNRMKEFRDAIMYENPDLEAVIFLNYHPHTERYLNIEEVVRYFQDGKKLPVYAYTDFGDIYQYTDIDTHLVSISLYIQLVRWFHI